MLTLCDRFGRATVVDVLRAEADALRRELASEDNTEDVAAAIEARAAARLNANAGASLRAVINATGVILHTNLGRAPLGREAAESVARLAAGYSNLEYDIAAGARGRRDTHAEALLTSLTGAEAACVVNNNAAATLLVLAALSAGREVIVSRGELVEIGGGFRVPDVMAQSGASLREVGTTNRTRASDYASVIGERTAAILRVHPSNFRIDGFTERPSLEQLVTLGRRFKIPVLEDLGSGLLTRNDVLRDEPTVKDSVAVGADVVMFSGDKLLGGPQAGIIVGTRAAIETIRRHPLMRALRVDKMTYAALEATLQAYSRERSHELPVMRMLTLTAEDIDTRAVALAHALTDGTLDARVVDGESTIGGGGAPGTTLPTRLVELSHNTISAQGLQAALRHVQPAVIVRIQDDRVVIDLRTVPPDADAVVIDQVKAAIGS
jgi:L-seryl-tRNA(Ser) seleniumtransferase